MLGDQPAYLFWIRGDDRALLAVVAVLTRYAPNETEPRGVQLRACAAASRPGVPAARTAWRMHTIEELKTSTGRTRSRTWSCCWPMPPTPTWRRTGADELKSLLQRIVGHLQCTVAALIVPEKGIALVRGATESKADGQLIARAHRQLLQIATANAHPVILNDPQSGPLANVISCRALVCPVRNSNGRGMGVLALLRYPLSPRIPATRWPCGRDPRAPRRRGRGQPLRCAQRPVHTHGVRAARALDRGRAHHHTARRGARCT